MIKLSVNEKMKYFASQDPRSSYSFYFDLNICFRARKVIGTLDKRAPGTRFSKVPIINGPGKLSPFTLKIEVLIVLHLT